MPAFMATNILSNRILILGSGGFLGRHLVSEMRSWGVIPFEVQGHADCDLKNYRAVLHRIRQISPDILIHLAASPDAKFKAHDSLMGFINTVLCTRNVVLAVKKVCPTLFIHVGSYKQYGNIPVPFRETVIPRPRTLYGMAKYISEKFLCMNQDSGLKGVCIRMGPVFGPGQDRRYLVAHTIHSILTRRSDHLVASDTHWDPIYVSDAVTAISLCMFKSQAEGRIINISGGISYSPYEIMCLIAEAMDEKNCSIIKLHDLIGGWNCLGDISLAKNILEWTPATPIPTAIKLTVNHEL